VGSSGAAVSFTKMEGCGNDYLFVDGIREPFPTERAPTLARAWADRRFGVGADGLILLGRDADGGLRMSMWNADGTRGAMCGNGLRCFARFADACGYAQGPAFCVQTDSGPRHVELLEGGGVRAEMGEVVVSDPVEVTVVGRRLRFVPGDAGNPHAVTFVADLERAPVEEVGAAMQSHPGFEGGVNVEFVQLLGQDRVAQRTFERGSGETLACGTGAAVAARAARRAGAIRGPVVQVELRGGVLTVHGEGAPLAIEGPARTVFSGRIGLVAAT